MNANKMGWKLENSYTKLPEKFYKRLMPNPVREPKLVLYNDALGKSLGLNNEALKSEEGVSILAGNDVPKDSVPIAQSYAGHQFGHFTMLGDGRAMLLGEQITPQDERVDIQLKGSGRTPYSRSGDGRAALGPMLREYIISEAMHGLNIPTTRSLAVISTGEEVQRETKLPGGVLVRTADSHIRVGTFQYAAAFGGLDDVLTLADYAIKRHDPDIDGEDKYLQLLKRVVKRQAALVSQWMLAGFIHGVMNTDNMTISGESIDYGPCAFMDIYHEKTVFSSIDLNGRYAYMNQPGIALWNLARFAEALLPLLSNNKEKAIELAQNTIGEFRTAYKTNWLNGMRAKLGIFNEEEKDGELIDGLLKMMEQHQADYTDTFLALTFNLKDDCSLMESAEFKEWEKSWKERLKRQNRTDEEVKSLMKNSNPAIIPRNRWVEEALEGAVERNDYRFLNRLLKMLENPYAHTEEQKVFAKLPVQTDGGFQTFCGT